MTMEIQQLMWKLEELTDAFREAVYVRGDVEAALACVTEDVELVNVPAVGGATGAEQLRRHLVEDVLPHRPADLEIRRLSRTTDQRRLAEESVVSFTHDRPMHWLLPGIEPTGRSAQVLAISMVSVRHRSRLGRTTSLISRHSTLWDHAGLLAQLGLAPAAASG